MNDVILKIFPDLPEKLAGLGELAYNLWWSWHPEARMLFKMLDRQLWKESLFNPVKMLKELPVEVLSSVANNPDYLRHYEVVLARFRHYVGQKAGWFRKNVDDPGSRPVAYFSAKYGLHHSLPFYAGGLGFLAADHIKECSDLGVPLTAVGFMYPGGYVRQVIREDGWQEGSHETIDRDAAPLTRVLEKNGEQLVVKVPLIEPTLFVAVWRVAVGRVNLYLMDADIEMNDPWNRGISARLYIGDVEQRLRQEIVLGIGGYRVLNTLGIRHAVLHLNEGHPAFALLERIKERIEDGIGDAEAVDQVRSMSIFTTHTPIPAGHDVFPFSMMEKYFNPYWSALGMNRETFFQLGINPAAPESGFNMTAFAMRMSASHNAVSNKHGEVTRRMWQVLWPDLSVDETPIDHVTNGIHVPTWAEPKMMLLFNKYLGPDWLEKHDDPSLWTLVDDIPDEELWHTHYWLKVKLINFIRECVRKHWIKDRVSTSIALAEGVMHDPSILTLGFARRFATYKRANLLLHDRNRLKKILNNPWRPVQIIFAGRAHTADIPGKKVIQEIFNAARDPELGGQIAFVEDYGEQLAQYMVHGVDVWLNSPLPPMEASGTSGMKAALNGVPHLSIMDGWWLEGFNGKNGWAYGRTEVDGNCDPSDAEKIYQILENEIIPLFYKVSDDGIPHNWVRIMKESIKSNGPLFSARQKVKEYVQKYYTTALDVVEIK
jgi:starch phosphorylase